MSIPDYQTLMLPLLKRLAAEQKPVPVRLYLDSLAEEFKLSPEERAERIPSGVENLLANRLAWARTYLGKAGLLQSPQRGMVSITPAGRELLTHGLAEINLGVLRRYPQFVEWMNRSSSPKPVAGESQATPSPEAPRGTPRERIDGAKRELDAVLRADLLERVRSMLPSTFEGLVIQLLLKMGYGDGQEEMAKALGGTGDGGMDGVIHQDPLGLDRVYIQAKRWKAGNNVGSSEIRDFVGALNINRAAKGVFVTASEFTSDAQATAKHSNVQVVLIDGERLTELMLRFQVGVLTRDAVSIYELDEGFFED
jgi:restriction system protein